MSLFERLRGAKDMKLLCGVTLVTGPAGAGLPRRFAFRAASGPRVARPDEYVLLALHYLGQILSRYPKDRPETYKRAGQLNEMVRRIIEEGVWPGSDLVRYAGATDGLQMVAADVGPDSAELHLALVRPLLAEDLDLIVEMPGNPDEDGLVLSVVALLQGLMGVLDEAGVQLLDSSLRYLRSYHEEGADYASLAAARNLANRAFRQAGGSAA